MQKKKKLYIELIDDINKGNILTEICWLLIFRNRCRDWRKRCQRIVVQEYRQLSYFYLPDRMHDFCRKKIFFLIINDSNKKIYKYDTCKIHCETCSDKSAVEPFRIQKSLINVCPDFRANNSKSCYWSLVLGQCYFRIQQRCL